jgi:hypothetical protein
MDPCNCCAKLKSIVEIHAPVLIIAWTCPTGGIITITMGGGFWVKTRLSIFSDFLGVKNYSYIEKKRE